MEDIFQPSGRCLPLLLQEKWRLESEGKATTSTSSTSPFVEGNNEADITLTSLLPRHLATHSHYSYSGIPLSRQDNNEKEQGQIVSNKTFTVSELEDHIGKITNAMLDIQQQLSRAEEVYFEETYHHGNLFKGWEMFIDAKDPTLYPPAMTVSGRRMPTDSRWFSGSYDNAVGGGVSYSTSTKPVGDRPSIMTMTMMTSLYQARGQQQHLASTSKNSSGGGSSNSSSRDDSPHQPGVSTATVGPTTSMGMPKQVATVADDNVVVGVPMVVTQVTSLNEVTPTATATMSPDRHESKEPNMTTTTTTTIAVDTNVSKNSTDLDAHHVTAATSTKTKPTDSFSSENAQSNNNAMAAEIPTMSQAKNSHDVKMNVTTPSQKSVDESNRKEKGPDGPLSIDKETPAKKKQKIMVREMPIVESIADDKSKRGSDEPKMAVKEETVTASNVNLKIGTEKEEGHTPTPRRSKRDTTGNTPAKSVEPSVSIGARRATREDKAGTKPPDTDSSSRLAMETIPVSTTSTTEKGSTSPPTKRKRGRPARKRR
jgi:hypothetical protein